MEETSDASPFAELIQRARDAMASGSQEDQVARRIGSHPHALLAGRRLLVGLAHRPSAPISGTNVPVVARGLGPDDHVHPLTLPPARVISLQDQILAEVDTQLTVSSARADAADAQLAAVQGQTDAAQVGG